MDVLPNQEEAKEEINTNDEEAAKEILKDNINTDHGEETAVKEDMIPKKVAALEVYKMVNRNKAVSLSCIFALFTVSVVSNFSKYGGAISAGIVSIGLGYLIYKNIQYIKYLEDEYKIVPKKSKLDELTEDDEASI